MAIEKSNQNRAQRYSMAEQLAAVQQQQPEQQQQQPEQQPEQQQQHDHRVLHPMIDRVVKSMFPGSAEPVENRICKLLFVDVNQAMVNETIRRSHENPHGFMGVVLAEFGKIVLDYEPMQHDYQKELISVKELNQKGWEAISSQRLKEEDLQRKLKKVEEELLEEKNSRERLIDVFPKRSTQVVQPAPIVQAAPVRVRPAPVYVAPAPQYVPQKVEDSFFEATVKTAVTVAVVVGTVYATSLAFEYFFGDDAEGSGDS